MADQTDRIEQIQARLNSPYDDNALWEDVAFLLSQVRQLRELLILIREWDQLPTCGDGTYWIREIKSAIETAPQGAPGRGLMTTATSSTSLFSQWNVEPDARVNNFIGYCPYCPLHEGIRAHVRLEEVTRIARQCPNCKRVYVINDVS